MAATTTTGFSIPAIAPVKTITRAGISRRRRISPEAGHALEVLGHANEYLTDEFVHEGGSFSAHNAQLEAVQLLMSLNRTVYFECPEVPTFRERLSAFIGRRAV